MIIIKALGIFAIVFLGTILTDYITAESIAEKYNTIFFAFGFLVASIANIFYDIFK